MARKMLENPDGIGATHSSSSSLSTGQDMAKAAKQIHKDIQAEGNTHSISGNRFLKYDSIGLRGDSHEGVASNNAAAFLKSLKSSNKPLPYNGVGLL